jgi:hypothetical protein
MYKIKKETDAISSVESSLADLAELSDGELSELESVPLSEDSE